MNRLASKPKSARKPARHSASSRRKLHATVFTRKTRPNTTRRSKSTFSTTSPSSSIPGISTHPEVLKRRQHFQQLAQTDPASIKPISIGTNGQDYPPFVFVLGGPGSGKGTHCDRLIEAAEKKTIPGLHDKIYHINVGGVLRNAQTSYRNQLQSNSISPAMQKAGPVLESMLATGQILPSWVTVTLLREELNRISNEIAETKALHNGNFDANVIIDGFPRSIENLQAFEELVAIPSRLLVMDVPTEVMLDRVLDRSKVEFREDDNFHTIKKRIDVFNSDTAAVLSQYCLQDSVEKALGFNKTHGVMRLGVKVWGDRPTEETSRDFIQAYIKLVNSPIY